MGYDRLAVSGPSPCPYEPDEQLKSTVFSAFQSDPPPFILTRRTNIFVVKSFRLRATCVEKTFLAKTIHRRCGSDWRPSDLLYRRVYLVRVYTEGSVDESGTYLTTLHPREDPPTLVEITHTLRGNARVDPDWNNQEHVSWSYSCLSRHGSGKYRKTSTARRMSDPARSSRLRQKSFKGESSENS